MDHTRDFSHEWNRILAKIESCGREDIQLTPEHEAKHYSVPRDIALQAYLMLGYTIIARQRNGVIFVRNDAETIELIPKKGNFIPHIAYTVDSEEIFENLYAMLDKEFNVTKVCRDDTVRWMMLNVGGKHVQILNRKKPLGS